MSTSLGVAAVALQAPSAQALDASSCMADVQALRAQETLGKGGQSVEAWADAAEVACEAGDYGIASAYIADAERRMNLKEAQRDESGTERADQAALDRDGSPAAGFDGTGIGRASLNADDNGDSVADDVGDFADDAGDEIGDAADDVGDEVEDVADDIGDEFDDFADDFNDPDSPTPEVRVMDSIRAAGPEGRMEARGIGTATVN
jgi:hypothetical protein